MKLFLLDSNGILCRYFYALPELFTEDGVLVNGLFGYCKVIKEIIKKNKNEDFAIIAVFDRCSKNFRKDIDITYKQNRKPADASLIMQLGLAEEFCKNVEIPVDFHINYEADDIIASFAKKHSEKNEIFVVTTDKDLMQLVNQKVNILNPFTKEIINTDYVKNKLGIEPEDVSLYLALCGDSSDNILGIKGVGPKTAVNIIKKTKIKSVMQQEFPKYDFSRLEHMLKLTNLFTDYETINPNPYSFNSENFNNTLKKFNFNSLFL